LYKDLYSQEIVKKLKKLKNKSIQQYFIVRKKMDFIISNPNHSYKNLHYTMKGLKRVQLGHFVLVFSINRKKKQVAFEDYNHHDKIYY